MARKNKIPWLDYTGQDTTQILACKGTHRIDSLLSALEQAIELRQKQIPAVATTPEEETLLAVMAATLALAGRVSPGSAPPA